MFTDYLLIQRLLKMLNDHLLYTDMLNDHLLYTGAIKNAY